MDATKQWFDDRFTKTRGQMIAVCNGISKGNLDDKGADRLYNLHCNITDAHKQMGDNYRVVFGRIPSPTYDDVMVFIESAETSIVNKRELRYHPK